MIGLRNPNLMETTMKKLLATAFVVTLMSSGPVLAESILGDPAGAITRQQWGMSEFSGNASNPAAPEPLAQVPVTSHGDNSKYLSQVPSATDHAKGATSDKGAAQ
jgi:hypothetical protein